jgi:hypothetical protein
MNQRLAAVALGAALTLFMGLQAPAQNAPMNDRADRGAKGNRFELDQSLAAAAAREKSLSDECLEADRTSGSVRYGMMQQDAGI